MASTTRTIWQAQQAQTRQATVRSAAGAVTVRTRQQAEQRLIQQTEERIARQANAQQLYETQEQPSIYAGQGRVLPLGAAGPITPRALQTTGTNRIGNPVQLSQGIVSSQPALGLDVDLSEIQSDLSNVAYNRGIRVIDFDPMDSSQSEPGIIYPPRYPYDQVYRSDTQQLYYWNPSTEEVEGSWVRYITPLVGEGWPSDSLGVDGDTYFDSLNSAVWHKRGLFWGPEPYGVLPVNSDPNDVYGDGSNVQVGPRVPTQLCWYAYIGALYRWQETTSEWVALLQQAHGNGAPTINGVVAGATYTDEAGDALYFWDATAGQWHQAGGGGGGALQSTQVRVDPPAPTHGQNTLLSWQEVAWDDLGIFNAATPSLITFGQAGRYQIEFTTAAQTLPGGGWTTWRFYFDVEAGPTFGADDREHQTNHYFPVSSSEHLHLYKSWSVEFEAGATIQVYAQQYNQSSSNLSLGLGNDYPTLTITKLS